MYHIPDDLRAKKSAGLIMQGLYKTLEQKRLKDVKISDIYANTYVSRATFYRLFDSVYDVLLYQCDLIVEEMLSSMKDREFVSKQETGLYCTRIWLDHDSLIKAIIENNLYTLLYDVIMRHKDGLKTLYRMDTDDDPYAEYFVYFLVAMIYTSFAVFYREKGKRPLEEVVAVTTKIVANIVDTWGIGGLEEAKAKKPS